MIYKGEGGLGFVFGVMVVEFFGLLAFLQLPNNAHEIEKESFLFFFISQGVLFIEKIRVGGKSGANVTHFDRCNL